MQDIRQPGTFEPDYLSVHGLNFSPYSRSIILEVLRGIGFKNENIHFSRGHDYLEVGTEHEHDFALLSHELDQPLDLELIQKLRRQDNPRLSAMPLVLLSSQATRSLIVTARDNGVDEVVMRPVSPIQLKSKLKQLIEAPRPFVMSSAYVGPCRRRKSDENYSGARRRIDDYKHETNRDLPAHPGADELAVAVSELREACGQLAEERVSLITRVRLTADRTMKLARSTDDVPLEKTAHAVKLYLEGVGSKNVLETHVLETGINALTQLAVLPRSYDSTRRSVANLMTVAVRKKLVVYDRRARDDDEASDKLLSDINQSDVLTDHDDHSVGKALKA